MTCPYQQTCGGCPYRNLDFSDYKKLKTEQFERVLKQINQDGIKTGEAVFIADGTRRALNWRLSTTAEICSLALMKAKAMKL